MVWLRLGWLKSMTRIPANKQCSFSWWTRTGWNIPDLLMIFWFIFPVACCDVETQHLFFCFFWWWLTPFTSDNLIAGFTDFWMSFPPILGWSNDEHMFWNGLNPPSSVKPTWPWLWVNISWLYDVHPAIPNGTWSNGQVRVVIPTKNSVRQCTWRAGGASFHFDGHVTIHQGHWQLLQVLLWWLDARLRQRWSSALSWCWSYKRSLGA